MDTPAADDVALEPGMEVFSVDGEKVGKIVSLHDAHILVEKGFFVPHDYLVPISAVARVDARTVYLAVSKQDVLTQRWPEPRATEWAATEGASPPPSGASRVIDASPVGAAEPLRIPVHEEVLTAVTRPVELGHVQINTQVVSEERTLEAPITEERVRVTRRAVDRAAAGAQTFQEGTVVVPVRTEQVGLQKRVRVAEEIEIAREAVQTTQQVSGTVRREVVEVHDPTNPDASSEASDPVAGSPPSSPA